MTRGDIIVKMTPFLYEDGNTYYFNIVSRGSTSYHDIFVYRKTMIEESVRVGTQFLFFPIYENKRVPKYDQINSGGNLVDTKLDVDEIKAAIKEIIKSESGVIEGWDGVVGDIPSEFKDRLLRDSRLGDILDN